jgi:sporulation protein YlmC with PRC-barrel domain
MCHAEPSQEEENIMKTTATFAVFILATVSALGLIFAGTASGQMSEVMPLENPGDVTAGGYPPEKYVVLPVPRGELKASKRNPILNKDVRDQRGDKLGTLEKLILDTKTGKVAYAVVSLEDGRLVALPWKDVKTTREKNAVIVRSTTEQLQTASGETAKEIEALMSPGTSSGAYMVRGELLKSDGGDLVVKEPSGKRVRVHLEEGTMMNRVPNAGDMLEAEVNEFDTARWVKTLSHARH